jgi:uncharacterized membrane protein
LFKYLSDSRRLQCITRYNSVYKQGNNKYFTMQQTEQIHYKNSIKKPHKHEILLDVQIPHAWNKQKQYQTMLLVTFLYLYMEQNFSL